MAGSATPALAGAPHPAPTPSMPAPALPARRYRCLPPIRQRPAHPATPSCLSSASSPECRRLSSLAPAHIYLRSGAHLSSTKDAVGEGGHQLQALRPPPRAPPDGGPRGPPEPPRHLQPQSVPGSGRPAAQEAAPRCKAGPRAPRVAPEDNAVGAVRQPEVLRPAPAPRPDQHHQGPQGLPLCLHAGDNPGNEGGPALEADPQWGVALRLPAAGPDEAVGAGPGSGDQPGHEAAPGQTIPEDGPTASPEDGADAAVSHPHVMAVVPSGKENQPCRESTHTAFILRWTSPGTKPLPGPATEKTPPQPVPKTAPKHPCPIPA
ncbi:uncharacterized protein LOC109364077 [Meleagris gallopavo]|uniref:uncharacterized protein LOC109364077 n=1 Tax=Meleagris gallopavo TaxID=9103 RepID=UPI00094062D1|nr:uncharacterized protein LOC109364077 [Meleagris gallopavo]